MNFEAEMKHVDKVRAIFYRALQCCPWAKVLYMDCVRLVPGMLQEVADLMTEKELRLRTPLEELDLLLVASQPPPPLPPSPPPGKIDEADHGAASVDRDNGGAVSDSGPSPSALSVV
jgi:hypothetical protein